MNTSLTQKQIDSYQKNEFVVCHDFLTDEQVASYQIGDILEDDTQNPLIYHRTRPYQENLAERFTNDQ